MDELLSEKEQLDAMRSWWQENGRYVIGGIVLGIALLVGWNNWQSRQVNTRIGASEQYEALMTGVSEGDLDAAAAAAAELHSKFSSTTYAAQAHLAMARLNMDKGRDQDAVDTLEELLEMPGNEDVKRIGRLRLAQVLLYQDKASDVVELLTGQDASAYSARYSEVLGDAYVNLAQYEDAADAYAIAIADDGVIPTVDKTLVQMKINDLPETSLASQELDEADNVPASEGLPIDDLPAEDSEQGVEADQ